MTKKEEQSKIEMGKLFNRLSYYFLMSKQPYLNVTQDMSIKKLQSLLDEVYENSELELKEQEAKKLKLKHK